MQWLRNWILRLLKPELFTGEPQPHEDKTLEDGSAIREIRKQGLVDVQSIGIGRDGDRVVIIHPGMGSLWIDYKAAQLIGQLGREIASDRLSREKI